MEQPRLALIDQLSASGQVLRRFDVTAWPVNVGRALDQHIVVDDPFVAAHHLQLRCDEQGQLTLHVGDTINGVQLLLAEQAAAPTLLLAGQSVALSHAAALDAGQDLCIGHTTLRVRQPQQHQTLAPEQKLSPASPPAVVAPTPEAVGLVPLALLVMALVALQQGLRLDPGANFTTAWLPVLTALPTLVLLWCGAWALMSKVFAQRLDFRAHAMVALPGLLALLVMQSVLPLVAANLGWPWLWRCGAPLSSLVIGYTVYRHLALVTPQNQRRAAVAVAFAGLAAVAFNLAVTHRSTQRLSAPPYMSTLPIPGLNATRAQPSTALVAELAPLGAALTQAAAQRQLEDQNSADDD